MYIIYIHHVPCTCIYCIAAMAEEYVYALYGSGSSACGLTLSHAPVTICSVGLSSVLHMYVCACISVLSEICNDCVRSLWGELFTAC